MQFKFNERIGLMSDLYRDNVNIILTKTIKHRSITSKMKIFPF